jgi:predicted lactoylglutathione lyase
MAKQIFVNLPVKDLARSKDFFGKLGFSFNPQFTDDTAACMVIGDNIYAMLLTHPKFREFTRKEIADATRTTEVMTALSVESREKVDEMFEAARNAGATPTREPLDLGFMFVRSFNDPDGHIWEVFWMDPARVQK